MIDTNERNNARRDVESRSCNRHILDTSTCSAFEDKISRIQHRKAMAGSCCVFAQESVIAIITLIAKTGSCCIFLLIICYNFYDTNSSFNLIHLPHYLYASSYPHKRNKVGLRSIYCTPVLLMHNGRTQDAGPVKRFDLYGFITKLVGILLCMS